MTPEQEQIYQELRDHGYEIVPNSHREHYVVVTENDGGRPGPDGGWLSFHSRIDGVQPEHVYVNTPIAWETPLGAGSTLQAAVDRARNCEALGYGKARIARLVFCDVTEVDQ